MKTSVSPLKMQRLSPGPQKVLQRLSSVYISSFITFWYPALIPSSGYMALISAHLIGLEPMLIAAVPAFNILLYHDRLLLNLQSTNAGLSHSLPDHSVHRGPERGDLQQCCPKKQNESHKKNFICKLKF